MTRDFETMWADLAPVGRGADGGYRRQPFTAAGAEARAWFDEECRARGLEVEEDRFGNVVAWWGVDLPGPAVLTGSHLDSVVRGGAFDGPLGVVSALAAVDRLRERGVTPARPLGVAVFAEEEGSRFPVACLGSRLAFGRLDWADARELRDRDGVALADLVPGWEGDEGGADTFAAVGRFVELHVEQGRDLVHRDAAVGLASEIWPHGRYRFSFTGRADHAGATAMADRRDPVPTWAATVLAATALAEALDGEPGRPGGPGAGARATFGRVQVEPNGTNAVPHALTAWLDARAGSTATLESVVAAVTAAGQDAADRDGTGLEVVAESVTPAVAFHPELTDRLARALERAGSGPVPVVPTAAGHDAGVLAQAGVPTSMLFVRNPTGVSHAPEEHATTEDCLAGVDALVTVLEDLLTGQPAAGEDRP